MKTRYRLLLVILVLILCVGCDQAVKSIARQTLAGAPPISLLNDSIHIEYSENAGAFLSLGSNLPANVRFLIFVVFVAVILVLTVVFAVNTQALNSMQLVGLSLLAGGGVGNFLDRLYNNGLVVDFIRLGIGPLRTGVFNVADLAIVAGAIMVVLFGAKSEATDTTLPQASHPEKETLP